MFQTPEDYAIWITRKLTYVQSYLSEVMDNGTFNIRGKFRVLSIIHVLKKKYYGDFGATNMIGITTSDGLRTLSTLLRKMIDTSRDKVAYDTVMDALTTCFGEVSNIESLYNICYSMSDMITHIFSAMRGDDTSHDLIKDAITYEEDIISYIDSMLEDHPIDLSVELQPIKVIG